MKSPLLMLAVISLLVACGPRVEPVKPKEPEKKSVAREAIEGFTGKTAVDNLDRAKPKIEAAGEAEKQKRKDLDELTGP